jgi:Domain found in Dishevelled, Egl-10, and Pleckstrin (DEP)
MSTVRPRCKPALISEVALAFKAIIVPGKRYQVDVMYDGVFTGREAVDTLCTLLQTSDRRLAMVVGRELEEQRLFHDVNHVHRLRDDGNKLYCFTHQPPSNAAARATFANTKPDAPSGVYTLFTRCYSPTCGLEDEPEACYSPLCPTFLRSTEVEEVEDGGNTSEVEEHGGDSWPDEEDEWGESFTARDSVRGCCYSPACTVGGYCYSPTCIKVSSANAALRLAGVALRGTQPDHGRIFESG